MTGRSTPSAPSQVVPDGTLGAVPSAAAPLPGQEREPTIKVLLVDASDRGGIATYTAQLRHALRDEGVEALLAAPAGLADEDLVLPGRRWGPDVARLGSLALYRLRLAELGPAAVALLRAVGRARPDVVHFQTDVLPGIDHLVLRLISRRVPVVITAHDPVPQDGGVKDLADQARRWRAVDAVIIHGEEPRRLVESSAGGTPVYVVPVDLRLGGPAIPRNEARRRLGLDDRPTALLLGLLRPYKGIDLLSEAWPKVAAALPHARLLLVGDPYECPALEELERAPGVEVRRGFIPEEELDWWAAAADVLVLPYRQGTHSGVLHRGLAAGTPVLASPSLAEETHRTGAGRVVPLDAVAWSESLVEVLGGHPLPRPPEPQGRQSALGALAVYRKVLASRSRSPGIRSRLRRRRLVGAAPIRVTYYVEGDTFGGVERHLLHLLDELDRERFDPMVLGVMAEDLRRELDARHVPLVPLARTRSKADVLGWFRVARAVQRARPDVFHAMLSQTYAAQYALVAAIARRTPAVVVTAHLPTESDSRLQERLRRFLLRGVDVQVLPSEWTRAELRRLKQLHPVAEVVANGIVLPPLLSREEAREVLGIPSTATVIGGSMRLVDWKRPDLLLEVARLLPGTTVVILGEGPERERLGLAARDVDLRLPGFRPDAVTLLPAFDVFLHPCPEDNQPLAVLEAMGAGVPVVVADTGGAALMVVDGRTGLVAPATAEGMAGATRKLVDDPRLREELASAARSEILAHFTAAAMTKRLEELYDGLLGTDPPACTVEK